MTTLLEFRAEWIRPVVTDATLFPDAVLTGLIKQGISDYSLNFPIPNYAEFIAFQDDQREFEFNQVAAEIYGITQVEYPIDEDPRRFLTRLSRAQPGFLGGQYYDLVGDSAIELAFGLKTGDSFRAYFVSARPLPPSDTAKIFVPAAHLDALKLFVLWKVAEMLKVKEAQNPQTTELVLSMLGTDAGRAERSYRAKIAELRENSGQGGFTGPWRADRWDRVY